jgi:hypothetical protein
VADRFPPAQIAEGRRICEIVCIADDAPIADLARDF